MKIIDIPTLVRSITDVYGPVTGDVDAPGQPYVPTAPELLAAMVHGVLEVHEHDLYRWNKADAQAIAVDNVALAEFAICKSCGQIDRDFFWCWTMRQLFVSLVNADAATPSAWEGWGEMTEAINRARAAYPGPVASAVIRSMNDPKFSTEYRSNLLDTVMTCTPSIPAQPALSEQGAR